MVRWTTGKSLSTGQLFTWIHFIPRIEKFNYKVLIFTSIVMAKLDL